MKKRYNSSEQILAEIDKCKEDVKSLLNLADALEIEAKRLMLIPSCYEDGRYKMKEVDRYRARAERLSTGGLRHLKEKLSEIMTPVLPGVGIEDESVCAR